MFKNNKIMIADNIFQKRSKTVSNNLLTANRTKQDIGEQSEKRHKVDRCQNFIPQYSD